MGGQSIPLWDVTMAEYVNVSFRKHIIHNIYKAHTYLRSWTNVTEDDIKKYVDEQIKSGAPLNVYVDKSRITSKYTNAIQEILLKIHPREEFAPVSKLVDVSNNILNLAIEDTKDETHQAMEAAIHNLNTLHCLPGSERIWVKDNYSDDIHLITMKELHKTFELGRYEALSINMETGNAEFKAITNSAKQDNHRDLVKITNDAGNTVTVTTNHKVLSIDTKNGDIIKDYPDDITHTVSPRGIKIKSGKSTEVHIRDYSNADVYKNTPLKMEDIKITPTLARILGIYCGDGSVISGSTISLATCDKYTEKELRDMMNKAFGQEISYQVFYMEDGRTRDFRFNVGTHIARFFKTVCGETALAKKVPSFILNSNKKVQKAFLEGYNSTDGRHNSKYMEVSSISEELVSGIQFIIFRLGELSTYESHDMSNRAGFPSSNYLHTVRMGNKAAKRAGVKVAKGDTKFEINKYDLSYVRDLIIDESPYIKRRHSNAVRYHELHETINEWDIDGLDHLENIFTIPIKSREYFNSKDEYVYDISVEDNENFVTEHMIAVSNSRAGAQVSQRCLA